MRAGNEGEGSQAKTKVRRARSKVGVEDGARLEAPIKLHTGGPWTRHRYQS
jgi:hypothetical protein